MLEKDLEGGGVGEEFINIRLIADPGPPSRTAKYLGEQKKINICIIPSETN